MSHDRRGKGTRPILESEIRAAQSIANSAMDAAKKLGVHYSTYKRWAKKYGVHDFFNQEGKGRPKKHKNPSKGKYPLNDILDGKHPDHPTHLFKKKLIQSEIKKNECEICGFKDIREDGQAPILIKYMDGNPRNKSLENVQFVCYNHAFIHGIEKSIRHDRFAKFEEPGKLQNTVEKIAEREGKVAGVPMNINTDELTEDEINSLLNTDE